MAQLFEKIDSFAAVSGIEAALQGTQSVICAFSGGADSSVLLRWLHSRLSVCKKRLVAAHVNHMIRGEESDADEAFCRRVCEKLGIPLYVEKVDVPARAAGSGMGLEECAREVRYAFLLNLSERLGGAAVATAHSATDNLETVIFHMTRGSGVRGVAGIAPVREIYIRPLLCCYSEEIREYAKESGIEYVTDSTNTDASYARNYIRAEIVPALRRLNPRADGAVLRLSAAAREDCEYIEAQADAALSGREFLSREEARQLHPSVFARVIRKMYRSCTGSASDLSDVNIRDCRGLVLSGCGSISLPGGCSFFVHKDRVFVDFPAAESEPPEKAELAVPGETVFGDWVITVSDGEPDGGKLCRNIYNLSIDRNAVFGKINVSLFVRSRRAGDTFLLGGMHKKVKKLMCDRCVPQPERDTLPLICDKDGILAIPKIGVRDGAAASSGGALHIFFEKRVK